MTWNTGNTIGGNPFPDPSSPWNMFSSGPSGLSSPPGGPPSWAQGHYSGMLSNMPSIWGDPEDEGPLEDPGTGGGFTWSGISPTGSGSAQVGGSNPWADMFHGNRITQAGISRPAGISQPVSFRSRKSSLSNYFR